MLWAKLWPFASFLSLAILDYYGYVRIAVRHQPTCIIERSLAAQSPLSMELQRRIDWGSDYMLHMEAQ
jgi:hypothetical protein